VSRDALKEEEAVSLGVLLLILLIIVVILALPTWPYSRGWRYYPSSLAVFLLVVVLILYLLGVLR
jgi:hypothetical protein